MVARGADPLVELRLRRVERRHLGRRVGEHLPLGLALRPLVEPARQVQLLEGCAHRRTGVARDVRAGLRGRPRTLGAGTDALVEVVGEPGLVVHRDARAPFPALLVPDGLRLAGHPEHPLEEGVGTRRHRRQRVGGDRGEDDGLGDVRAVLRRERPPVAVLPLGNPVRAHRGLLAERPAPQRGVEAGEVDLGVELAGLVDEGDRGPGGEDAGPVAEDVELTEHCALVVRAQRRRDEDGDVRAGIRGDGHRQGDGGEPLGAHAATSSGAKASR